ncbi:MAG: radical SAM protein [Chloroflexota bacterium]|nr:radical SAM protein [Chloroflexota bacterium]
MNKNVFGPVPSRRLGQSLGIDPVPLKSCNWNCVYCQLGRTHSFVLERQSFYKNETIIPQVQKTLASHGPGEIDWITFVGSGETTLHLGLGEMIREVKSMTKIPVAVITNGSLLYLDEVREELKAADAVLPTLDAGNPNLYHKINRPHPELTFERLVSGLISFRKVYKNKLWVEVMLVRGLNDSEEALKEIAGLLEQIQPDEVHIVQPTRPPVELWVKPPDDPAILRAQIILGAKATAVLPAKGTFDLSGEDDLVNAIVEIITRHPMQETELVHSLKKWSPNQIKEVLHLLEDSGRAQVVIRYNTRFWSASEASFPE